MAGSSLIILHLAASQIDGNKIACLTCLTTNYVSQPMCRLCHSIRIQSTCCAVVMSLLYNLISTQNIMQLINYNCFV